MRGFPQGWSETRIIAARGGALAPGCGDAAQAALDLGKLRPDLRTDEYLRLGRCEPLVALPAFDRVARLRKSGFERPGLLQRLAEERLCEIRRVRQCTAAERS